MQEKIRGRFQWILWKMIVGAHYSKAAYSIAIQIKDLVRCLSVRPLGASRAPLPLLPPFADFCYFFAVLQRLAQELKWLCFYLFTLH